MPRDSFSDSVAIVTGAGSGIGLSLANALAARGARTVLADRDFAAIQEASRTICETGGRAVSIPVDVGDSSKVAALLNDTISRYGRIDYLFNNAGLGIVGETINLELADWQRVITVNLMGVVHGVVAAYPVMVRQRSGHIVNIASTAGILPAPFQVPYAASKHAVVGLSLSLRAEAAKYGVRVSVVCPGWIDTQMKDTQEVVGIERETVIDAVPFKYYSAARCADDILKGVERNRRMIFVPRFPKWADRVNRWFPWLVERITAYIARRGL